MTYHKGVKMKSNFIVKAKHGGFYGVIYNAAYDTIYHVLNVVAFFARFLSQETLAKWCSALQRQEKIEGDRSIAARVANELPEIRGYNDDRYDILSDFHADIHNIILNKFGVERCRAL